MMAGWVGTGKPKDWWRTKTEPSEMQEGEPCGKCSTPVIKRTGKGKPGRDYYREFHLICPKCRALGL